MYAVIQDRGHQYRAAKGDRLTIDRNQAEVGAIALQEVAIELTFLEKEASGKTGSH